MFTLNRMCQHSKADLQRYTDMYLFDLIRTFNQYILKRRKCISTDNNFLLHGIEQLFDFGFGRLEVQSVHNMY